MKWRTIKENRVWPQVFNFPSYTCTPTRICVLIYIQTHTHYTHKPHTCTCTYSYLFAHTHTNIHYTYPPNLYMCTYSYLCVYTHKAHTCIHTARPTHVHVHLLIFVCSYAYNHIHTYTTLVYTCVIMKKNKKTSVDVTGLHFLPGSKSGILLALTRFFFLQFICMVLGIDPGPHVCQANAQHRATFLSPFTS